MPNCLKIKQANGGIMLIPAVIGQSISTKPGDVVLGVAPCDGSPAETMPRNSGSVDVELAKEGLQLGDAIAWATNKLGVQKCAKCTARQAILNSAKQLGWKETIRQIKETFK